MTDQPKCVGRRFLTIEQVAEELCVGVPTVRHLLAEGELRGIQVGGRGLWRVGGQDLEDYIDRAYRVAADRIVTGKLPDQNLGR